ncbi:MAG TPA: hypothetical protein VNH84_13625, partial [Candidatus Saccharimonadales bacterium]|nr:hypothetical protein [Candidatus Saccharimonadales bacterium]
MKQRFAPAPITPKRSGHSRQAGPRAADGGCDRWGAAGGRAAAAGARRGPATCGAPAVTAT